MLVTPPKLKLNSIQALRGLAALLVLIFHCAALQRMDVSSSNISELNILSGFWEQGYAGVDLFFVISGFIMVYVTYNTPRSPAAVGRFIYSRISRIYPLWWLFAGLMMIYFFMTYGQFAAPDVARAPSDVGPYIAKSLLLFPQDAHPVLGVGWTLIHEMYFYLIFASLLFFSRKIVPLFLTLWAVLLIIAIWQFGVQSRARDLAGLFISPLTLEFIAGGFAGLIIRRSINSGAMLITVLSAAGMIVALSVGLDETAATFTLNRVLLYTLPFAGLIYGLSALEQQGRIKMPKFMVRLGDWSYSLYLSHMFVLLALKRVHAAASPNLPEPLRYLADGSWDNLLFGAFGVSLAIIVSALSYRFAEVPLLNLTRKVTGRKPLAE